MSADPSAIMGGVIIILGMACLLGAGRIQSLALRFSHTWPPDQSPWFEGFQRALIASRGYLWAFRVVGAACMLFGVLVVAGYVP